MSDDPRDVPLEGLLDLVVDLVCDRIRGFEIGRVTAYDSAKQKVSVQPVVQRSHLNEAGQRVSKPSQEIHEAIVVFPGGPTGRITVPISKGDYGLLIYSSVSLDRWKLRGGVVDPGDDRRHDPSDAVFVPSVHDFAHVPTPAPTDAIVVHAGPGVKVLVGGAAGTQKTLMADSFLSALDSLVSSIATAVGGIIGAPSGPIGAAAGAAIASALVTFQGAVRTTYKTSVTELK